MTENALYKLQPVFDDPRYAGFGFVRNLTLRGTYGWRGRFVNDFKLDPEEWRAQWRAKGRGWQAPRMAPYWTPQPVIGRVRAFNDYPCVSGCVPAFSRRAVDALRDYLEPNGELLPLVSDLGEYYAYNVTTIADILDLDRSAVNSPDREHVSDWEFPHFQRHECLAEKMVGLSIFRLVEDDASPFVAQCFVERVKACGLQGFHFAKLWPLPPGVNWFLEDAKLERQRRRVKTARGPAPVKGNAVVLCIMLSGDSPTDVERLRTKRLLDKLDKMLVDPAATPDSPYFGSVEGDQFVPGEAWIFISCPDADALVEKLRPWLKKVSGEAPIKVLKRYGEYVDDTAPGEWENLS